MSIEQLAKVLDIDEVRLTEIDRDEELPTPAEAKRIAAFFGTMIVNTDPRPEAE